MLLRYWIFVGFAITAPAQTFTTLASFNGTNGSGPAASLFQGNDGNFYGTTYIGGPFFDSCENDGCGTIFEITPAGTLTTLYSFC